MAEERGIVQIDNWDDLFTRESEIVIPTGASPFLRNVEFFKDGWRSRNGYTLLNSTDLGTSPITSIFDGWNHVLASESDKVHSFDTGTGTFTERKNGLVSGAVPDWASYNALDIMVNGSGNDAPQKWDGSSWGALGGSPPKGDTIAVFNNRVWIGGLASPNQSEVQFSKLEDPESWEGGFLRVSKREKGHTVKAVRVVPVPGAEGGERLAVFCDDAIFHFAGFHRETFRVFPIASRLGAVSAKGIQVAEGITYWVDENGIYASPDGGSTINHISWRIQPDFDNLNKSRLANCASAMFRYKRQIWWCFSDGAATTNDIILVYNYGLSNPMSDPKEGQHVWTIYKLQDGDKGLASMGEVLVSGEYLVYGGDNTDGWMYQMDNGTNDNGVAFEWNHRTKKLLLENWSQYLILRKFTAIHDLTAATTITIEMFADLAKTPTASSDVSFSPTGSVFGTGTFGTATWGGEQLEAEEVWYNKLLRAVQFELSSDDLDRQFNCFGIQVEANPKRGMR